jgi:ubiquinone/menaquinone biosynthesis C-methylase UbiE
MNAREYPVEHKETVKSGYNAIASRYLAERTRDSEDIRLLEDLMGRLPVNAKVLDAGCGAGIPVTQILSRRFNVTGVDFSEVQIELARKNVPNASFICQDMTMLGFPDNTFDAICSYYAIIHIPREEHLLLFGNFHRMLKTGGFALLCLGAEDLADDIDEDYLGTRMYWSHFDAGTYLRMLHESGFASIWSKIVADETCEGGGHLFVLVQKLQP